MVETKHFPVGFLPLFQDVRMWTEGPLVLTESKGPSQCEETEKYWQSGWKGHQLLAWRYRKTWKEKSKICFLEHQQRSAKQQLGIDLFSFKRHFWYPRREFYYFPDYFRGRTKVRGQRLFFANIGKPAWPYIQFTGSSHPSDRFD